MEKAVKYITKEDPLNKIQFTREMGFQFQSDSEYAVLINCEKLRAIVEMPDGMRFDEDFEYYFENPEPFEEQENGAFYEWLKALLMSIEFFRTPMWVWTGAGHS